MSYSREVAWLIEVNSVQLVWMNHFYVKVFGIVKGVIQAIGITVNNGGHKG